MRSNINLDESDIDQIILNIIKTENPQFANDLAISLQNKLKIPKRKALDYVSVLHKNGKIILKEESLTENSLIDNLFSNSFYWFFGILIISIITTIVIVFDLSNFPIIGTAFILIRFVFGSIFVLFIPGYSFIKVLFPLKEIDIGERISLSIIISLALTAINVLILNYTPWGIKTIPLTIGLLGISIGLSTIALVRTYQTEF